MSQHIITFDDTNKNWSPITEHNCLFLKRQEQYLNSLLKAKGFLFLNQVHEFLGCKWTPEGQVEGWTVGGSIELEFFFTDNVVEVTFATEGSILHKIEQDGNSGGPRFHDVLLVAVDISGPDAETAHKVLMDEMVGPGEHPNGVYIDSWWVANDERFDGSDCDSAVFVSEGSQENARRVLRSHGYAN